MKYRFDLLPEEYRSSPRDTFGILVAAVVVIVTLFTIGAATMKSKAAFNKIDKEIATKDEQLRGIVDNISKLQPPIDKINELKNKIDFINKNLNTPATDVVAFLSALEACVPENVVVRDLNPKKFNDLSAIFTINGEASTIQDILELSNRLSHSGKFKSLLKSNENIIVSEQSMQSFIMEISYKKPVQGNQR